MVNVTRVSALIAFLATLSATQTQANINLELRPVAASYQSGQLVEVQLYAVSDDTSSQVLRALNVILQWDPTYLELLGVDNDGPYGWLMSGFFSDSELDGLNADCGPHVFCDPYTGLPFNDGNAYYQAVGNFSDAAHATPEGLHVTTILFRALSMTPGTEVDIPLTLGGVVETGVAGDPGEDVTGTLGSAVIRIDPAPDWGDLTVRVPDGACGPPPGQTVTVLLEVSNLLAPINGVQALLDLDEGLLTLDAVLPGDGAGSPWDPPPTLEVHGQTEDGTAYVVLVWPGGGSGADAVVARIRFTALYDSGDQTANVDLVAQAAPLVTGVTLAADATLIIPNLHGPAALGPGVECNDGLFCDGMETCSDGVCQAGSDPCPDQMCDENGQACVDCLTLGDVDGDGYVRLTDYAAFFGCRTGPVGPVDPPAYSDACQCLDGDADGDVDLADYDGFQRGFFGP